ncbi:hypothetical protein SeMB42_g02623 [Synchytrium endobioticum]|nr:hypothetical protein SeMB42_g02621 [Synchytrium endobioticum]TPX49382.1 hypothetical protein SeMB42_g02623 [Synchytrium endobioticum]
MHLSQAWFNRIIDERDANLANPLYTRMHDVETYAEHTASCLLYLHLEALGLADVHADHVASHIGKALGITALLRGTPRHLAAREFHLPSQTAAKHGVAVEHVRRHGASEPFRNLVFEVATAAHGHIATARAHAKGVPASAAPALLLSIPCEAWLNRLQDARFDLFDPSLARKSWMLPWTIWKHTNCCETQDYVYEDRGCYCYLSRYIKCTSHTERR